MTVKSLSQMMKPGTVGASGDCDTCGPSGAPTTVTRVAMQNLSKLNAAVPKAVAQPVPAVQPIQAQQIVKSLAVAVGIEEETEDEKPKNKGGRPRIEKPESQG